MVYFRAFWLEVLYFMNFHLEATCFGAIQLLVAYVRGIQLYTAFFRALEATYFRAFSLRVTYFGAFRTTYCVALGLVLIDCVCQWMLADGGFVSAALLCRLISGRRCSRSATLMYRLLIIMKEKKILV